MEDNTLDPPAGGSSESGLEDESAANPGGSEGDDAGAAGLGEPGAEGEGTDTLEGI